MERLPFSLFLDVIDQEILWVVILSGIYQRQYSLLIDLIRDPLGFHLMGNASLSTLKLPLFYFYQSPL